MRINILFWRSAWKLGLPPFLGASGVTDAFEALRNQYFVLPEVILMIDYFIGDKFFANVIDASMGATHSNTKFLQTTPQYLLACPRFVRLCL